MWVFRVISSSAGGGGISSLQPSSTNLEERSVGGDKPAVVAGGKRVDRVPFDIRTLMAQYGVCIDSQL